MLAVEVRKCLAKTAFLVPSPYPGRGLGRGSTPRALIRSSPLDHSHFAAVGHRLFSDRAKRRIARGPPRVTSTILRLTAPNSAVGRGLRFIMRAKGAANGERARSFAGAQDDGLNVRLCYAVHPDRHSFKLGFGITRLIVTQAGGLALRRYSWIEATPRFLASRMLSRCSRVLTRPLARTIPCSSISTA
jgi:hypothetical protein